MATPLGARHTVLNSRLVFPHPQNQHMQHRSLLLAWLLCIPTGSQRRMQMRGGAGIKTVQLLGKEPGDTCLIQVHAEHLSTLINRVEAKLNVLQGLRPEIWFQGCRRLMAGVCRTRVSVGDIDAICRDETRRHITPSRVVSAGFPCR